MKFKENVYISTYALLFVLLLPMAAYGAGGISFLGNQIVYGANEGDLFGEQLAVGDFNPGGLDDLVIGVTGADIGGVHDTGAVKVLYSALGLSVADNMVWHQENDANYLTTRESGDGYGNAIAAGDFNGDGIQDLAVGVPFESKDNDGVQDVGEVNIFYGGDYGLSTVNHQLFYQGYNGTFDMIETGDHFGYSLSVGDFNNDGYDDLAIGIPGEDIGSIENSGAVGVIYGSEEGLSAFADQFWHQDQSDAFGNVEGIAEAGDRFGHTLVADDFNGDGYDDLAIGVPNENVEAIVDAGAVNILFGSAQGLITRYNQIFYQGNNGISGTPEGYDYFGNALAAGDFNKDGFSDLAIGVPHEDHLVFINMSPVQFDDAGQVHVIFGSGLGLTPSGNQYWTQNSTDVAGEIDNFDIFGWSLAAGDYNGDGYCDLAIGVPGEDVNGKSRAGAVNVLYGSEDGPSATSNQLWHQNSLGVKSSADYNESFGVALTSGDFDGDGNDDLAIGVPHERAETTIATGAVNILYGSGAVSICPGDFDGDGDVDGSDLATFAADFGRTDCP